MPKKVGIPRALFYYQYYPLWKTFMEELGAEIVVSDFTTKSILDDGVKSCVDEACLPVKLFHGHILNLKDKVDYLFIPRFTSVSKNEYICPKFGGLPDMVRHTLSGIPEIIDVEVNMRKSRGNSLKAAIEVGQYFCDRKAQIKDAYIKAVKYYRNFRKYAKTNILTSEQFENWMTESRKPVVKNHKYGRKILELGAGEPSNKLNIAVLGHVYNLYDNFINMDMVYKLMSSNVNVITIDMIDGKIINEKSKTLKKRFFWNFGRKAYGSAMHLMDMENIDGIIYVMSFGCGVDSFVSDLIERNIRRSGDIPFIVLTIDEHSGEAGMDTRLEAFLDMIRWRNKNEADISAYG